MNDFFIRDNWIRRDPNHIYFKAPALTYKIAESYFQNHLSGQEADYVLENGYYTRTIPEADLTLEFGTNDAGVDGKRLKVSHSLVTRATKTRIK